MSTPSRRSGVEGFADLVDPLVTRCQLPGMVERIRQGETLRFGLLRLAPDAEVPNLTAFQRLVSMKLETAR
ncbi:hypothetical protein [Actinomadura violacea]|uniref:Uncharacterized protein n=1 Tax=Actinomadura violacea TaxID=2819934 RepID=A0ABS3SA11_9ACTN|nr:hypothetical protein [Actinomadura violacea]MBO2465845.1 hypothetical protein [Actinomadura violacea]